MLRFGGAVIVKDCLFSESFASMKTRRALEWKAWLEKPRSMRATVNGFITYVSGQAKLITYEGHFKC